MVNIWNIFAVLAASSGIVSSVVLVGFEIIIIVANILMAMDEFG